MQPQPLLPPPRLQGREKLTSLCVASPTLSTGTLVIAATPSSYPTVLPIDDLHYDPVEA